MRGRAIEFAKMSLEKVFQAKKNRGRQKKAGRLFSNQSFVLMKAHLGKESRHELAVLCLGHPIVHHTMEFEGRVTKSRAVPPPGAHRGPGLASPSAPGTARSTRIRRSGARQNFPPI